jgi:hypothetical protein
MAGDYCEFKKKITQKASIKVFGGCDDKKRG